MTKENKGHDSLWKVKSDVKIVPEFSHCFFAIFINKKENNCYGPAGSLD